MADHLGSYNTSSSRTHVGLQFTTNDGSGGAVAPSDAFEAADIRIYRAADGAAFSATQRSSSSGITMTSPFDSVVGLHSVDIDLTDNTDAGFYAAGYRYAVVLSPDTETVDGQSVVKVLAYFEVGPPQVNVTQLGGAAQSLTDLKDFADTGYDPATHKVAGVVLVDTLTTYTGNTVQTGDAYARLGAPAGASHAADVAAVQADTNDIQTRLPASLVSGRMDSSVGAMAANTLTASALATDAVSEVAAGVWDLATSGHATSGTFGAAAVAAGGAGDPWSTSLPGSYGAGTAGYIIGNNLNATVSSRSTYAGGDTSGVTTLLTRIGGAITISGGKVAATMGATDYSGNTVQTGDAYARLGSPAGASVSADVAAVKSDSAAILDDTGTFGVVLSSATCNKIADHGRRRTQAAVELSSDGDALSLGSLYGFIQMAQESNTVDTPNFITVYRTDGTTSLGTKAVSTDPAAEPITSVS